MKYLVITVMLLPSIIFLGQIRNLEDIPEYILEQLDKLGVDNSPLLNSYESAYLNMVFKDSLNGFDFTEKRVKFIKINGECEKFSYFDMQKKYIINKNSPCDNGILYIFDESQKEESGGYDAAIVYWSKKILSIKEVIKRLKKCK